MSKNEFVWSRCRSCKRSTKHEVLGLKSKETDPDFYHSETKYYLIECKGCETISFRQEEHDYESIVQVGPDDYEHDVSVEIFPHFIAGHNPIESIYYVPRIVESIYKESLIAIQEGAYTLAGLGLRATIEAICNERNITGRNLQVRINNMHRNGIASKADVDRLHAIRFMGNDAAHEIKKANKTSVLVALKIVEHILISIYVFEEEVNKHLEKPISSAKDAIPTLKLNLNNIEDNSSFTFSKWLGSSKRRILEKIDEIEADLIELVRNQEFENVILVEGENVDGEQPTQWYKKIELPDSEKDEDDEDFDIPF
ncbi:DUF4145 domain-containing protein [Vibrio sp. J2-3(2022)]|uniref:DUF4145 domain-containing protein n=1 Tax=Vibrio TaxID=662 RepID=UPI001F1B756B|nr:MULTISPECIES: DUF4145 domain-containing protein [Vibrio]MCF7370886.1 DUF4145 domain-containing protein [Vibrio sp. J2-3(2022)]MCS0024145.1 DUF4145 domain-containing protein [Vibrio antiquarius]